MTHYLIFAKNVRIAVKQCPFSSSHGSSWYSCWKKSSVNYCGCVLSLLMKLHCSCFTYISAYCFGFLKSVTREVSDLQWKMDMGNIPQGLDYCRMLWREENVRLNTGRFTCLVRSENTVFLLAMQGMFNHNLLIPAFIKLPPLTVLSFFFFNLCHQNKLIK